MGPRCRVYLVEEYELAKIGAIFTVGMETESNAVKARIFGISKSKGLGILDQ